MIMMPSIAASYRQRFQLNWFKEVSVCHYLHAHTFILFVSWYVILMKLCWSYWSTVNPRMQAKNTRFSLLHVLLGNNLRRIIFSNHHPTSNNFEGETLIKFIKSIKLPVINQKVATNFGFLNVQLLVNHMKHLQ